MQEYRSTMTPKESNFWFNQAKKQSFHKEDKNIQYEPEAEKLEVNEE